MSINLQAIVLRYRSHTVERLVQLKDYTVRFVKINRIDLLLALVLAVVAMLAVMFVIRQHDQRIVTREAEDVWFQADVARVYLNMTDRWSDHYRTKVHPLFSLAVTPLVYGLMKGFAFTPLAAVQLVQVFVAAGWIVTLFALLRLLGCRRLDAVLFSAVASTSAAAIFWLSVPETYGLGSWSILLSLVVVLLAQNRTLAPHWYALVSVLSLSFTITNWMAGIIATFVSNHWRRALQITVNALCIVVLLWSVQKYVFPSAGFFLGDREEAEFLLLDQTGGPLRIVTAELFHSMVMPAITSIDNWSVEQPVWQIMTVQHALPGSASVWGMIAVVAWVLLLVLGIWALCTLKQQLRFRITLGLLLAGQLGLHLVYGDETFLYSLHFLPLLVILTALTTLTRARILALALALCLLVGGTINNTMQFSQAADFFTTHTPAHQAEVSTTESQ